MRKIVHEAYENRCFELEVAKALRSGLARPPIYLSVGTEHIPVVLKNSLYEAGVKDYVVFPQHRCHSYFLTFSEDKEAAMASLRDELCGLDTGCGKGMWGSASLHIKNKMIGHNGHLGSQASIACGYAQATGKKVICILGDAACEEDDVLAALGYAATHKLNIMFLVENNGLSILTETSVRRSWSTWDVAKGFGLKNESVSDRFESLSGILCEFLDSDRPCLLDIECCRHLWHAGAGTDGPPLWDTLKDMLLFLPKSEQTRIEQEVADLWKQ
jgi:TPP-dependent pyruvate/acetoin dehydrogenase alpha subunit